MRKLEEKRRESEKKKTVSRALACSLLLIHSLCGVGRGGIEGEEGL